MAVVQLAQLVGKAAPVIAKQLPKLWPLLLESKNREKVSKLLTDLANSSPTRRLRARVQLTAELADAIAEQAKTDRERAQAEAWSDRARKLQHQLDMPIAGIKEKRAHRREVKGRLQKLQNEMNRSLAASPQAGMVARRKHELPNN